MKREIQVLDEQTLIYADKGESTEKQYYVTDPHGNVVQLTDEGGRVIKTYEYDSFGNEVKPDEKDDNPFRYCGEYYDRETGEVYLRARYYQQEVGRFLTRDTYTGEEDDLLSLHLYTYCGNDGVNGVDPSGHDSYVIYDKNAEAGTPGKMFKDEANDVREKYGKDCYFVPVENAHDFKKKWDKFLGKKVKRSKKGEIKKVGKKKVKINKVYIIMHGMIDGPENKKTKSGKYKASGYGFFEDGGAIYAKKTKYVDFNPETDIEVKDLKKKTLNILTFSTCQSATSKGYSLAKMFKKRMNVKQYVEGYGAVVGYNYYKKQLEAAEYPGRKRLR